MEAVAWVLRLEGCGDGGLRGCRDVCLYASEWKVALRVGVSDES